MANAERNDRVLPVAPLHTAIQTAIKLGCRGDERKMRDFYGGIMVVGGGSKVPWLNTFLEERLKENMPGFGKEILVGGPPREIDAEVVCWKGASVFGKLSSSGNDSWIHGKDYDMLGAKLLAQTCMWNW